MARSVCLCRRVDAPVRRRERYNRSNVRRLIFLLFLCLGCGRGEPPAVRTELAPTLPAESAKVAAPTPASPAEQRSRCLTYTAERAKFGESRKVVVRVRNSCDITIAPEESQFEITAMPASGQGIAGRATGSFQTPIAPHSSNVETVIEVDCPGDVRGSCKYYVEAK